MVRFENDKLVIEIPAHSPSEKWLELHKGICDILRFVTQENIIEESYFNVVDFLEDMMPDYADAKKLVELKKIRQ